MPYDKLKKSKNKNLCNSLLYSNHNENEEPKIIKKIHHKELTLNQSLKQLLKIELSKGYDGFNKENAYAKFWEIIDKEYFQDIQTGEICLLNDLCQNLNKPIKTDIKNKYISYQAYNSVKNILCDNNKDIQNGNENEDKCVHNHMKLDHIDKKIQKLNIKNIKKHFELTTLLNQININKKSQEDLHSKLNEYIKIAYNKNDQKYYLINNDTTLNILNDELNTLDKILNEFYKDIQDVDEISIGLNRKIEEYKNINDNTKNLIKKLMENIQHNVLDYNSYIEKEIRKNIEREYIEKIIICMENKQIAESIKYITDVDMSKYPPINKTYCVMFDDALKKDYIWMKEHILNMLDKFRENSIFTIYNIPSQKLPRSIACHNVIGHQICSAIMQKKPIKAKRTQDLRYIIHEIYSKRKLNEIDKNILIKQINEYNICHYCKLLYPQNILIKCKNHEINNNYDEHDDQEKNELVNEEGCLRYYCRYCLRQVYDEQIEDIENNTEWMCPYCQKTCYCTRCIREYDLTKYELIYKNLDGKISQLRTNSLYEQLIMSIADNNESIHNISPIKKCVPKKKNRKPKLLNLIKVEAKDNLYIVDNTDIYQSNSNNKDNLSKNITVKYDDKVIENFNQVIPKSHNKKRKRNSSKINNPNECLENESLLYEKLNKKIKIESNKEIDNKCLINSSMSHERIYNLNSKIEVDEATETTVYPQKSKGGLMEISNTPKNNLQSLFKKY